MQDVPTEDQGEAGGTSGWPRWLSQSTTRRSPQLKAPQRFQGSRLQRRNPQSRRRLLLSLGRFRKIPSKMRLGLLALSKSKMPAIQCGLKIS